MNTQTKMMNTAPINWSALLRAAMAPALLWASVSLAVTIQGQPGVMCLTPMAWLLSIWGGTYYGRRQHPSRPALSGGLLASAITGVIFAALFIFGSTRMLAGETRPQEITSAYSWAIGMGIASVVVCTLLTAIFAQLTQTRVRH